MGERRIINGAIYEKTPDGIVLVGPAPSASSSVGNIVAPNPVRAAKEAMEQRRRDEADARAAATEARNNAAAIRAEREWNATHNPDGSPKANGGQLANIPVTAAAGIQENLKTLRALDDAIASLKGRPDSIGPGTGMLGDTFTQYHDPDGTGVRAAVGAVGAYKIHDLSGAAVSASEAPRFTPFVPSATDRPEVATAKLQKFREALVGQIREAHDFYSPANNFRQYNTPGLQDVLAGKAQQHADNEVPDPTTGADLKPPSNDPNPNAPPPENGGDIAATDGKSRIVRDPRVSAQVDAMINAGASKAMIDAVLKRQGFPTLNAGDLVQAKKWMKENPGKKYFGSDPTRVEDLNLGQKVLANEYVAPVAAGLANYADAATAGTVGTLAGEEGRGTLNAAAALNPISSTLGNIAGGVTGAMGAEAALAARAPAALAKYAPRIADTLYGGLYGYNTAKEGEGLQGALWGAAGGLGGGILGEKVMRGAGSALRGVTNPAVRALRASDIPMTVGQIVGNGGMIGRGVKKVEDALTSVPFVGNMVDARRREGVEAFANEMANAALEPIGGTSTGYGQGTVDDLLQQGSDAYTRATAGAVVPLDEQFPPEMADVRQLGELLPEDLASRFGRAVDNRVKPIEDAGYMTGDSFQQAVRGLKSYRAEAPKPGFEQDYRDALSKGIDALRGQMTRGGGADVIDNLGSADQAWKGIKIFQRATEAAKNGARSGEVGLPMPSHFNDAATAAANKYGGPRFNGDLIDAGQSVLPSKIGESGTFTRALVGGGSIAGLGTLGGLTGGPQGAATGSGTGLGVALLLAAGGSKAGQAAMRKALLERPDLAVEIGNALSRNASIGGWTGAGALTPLLVGN